jgi:hypothetical protein
VSKKYLSRRFGLAVLFSTVGSVALFTGDMDGGTYVALVTVIMGVYGASTYFGRKAENSVG